MIEIALASDANYVCGLLVTAVSMARSASESAQLRFNVLDGGIPDEAWVSFENQVRAVHHHAEFRRIRVDDARFAKFPEWNGRSRATYARLLLPQALPDVEYIVYCDVDFLWFTDVADLWNLRDDRVAVQSVPDGAAALNETERIWFAANGLSHTPERYFCAGMMVLNLRIWRELGIAERILHFLDRHPDVPTVDQTALNAVLGAGTLAEGVENIRMLPFRWQLFSRFVTAEDLRAGCAIHYAGDTPWGQGSRIQPLTDVQLLWHDLHGELMGGDRRTSLRRFFTPGTIAFRRFMFRVATVPVLRGLLFAILRLTGRAGYIWWFNPLRCAQ